MAYTKILLTENVPNLGAEGDVTRVRRGYARNFLIPRSQALELDKNALRRVNHLKAKRAEREARELALAEELASKLSKLKFTFDLAVGETGKAFGSITAKDIHDRLMKEVEGLDLPRQAVMLEKSIKDGGEHIVEIKVHPDVLAKIRVQITVPKREEKPTEEEDNAKRKPRAPRKAKETEVTEIEAEAIEEAIES